MLQFIKLRTILLSNYSLMWGYLCSQSKLQKQNPILVARQWRAEGGGANGATPPGIQGRGAPKEWNFKN